MPKRFIKRRVHLNQDLSGAFATCFLWDDRDLIRKGSADVHGLVSHVYVNHNIAMDEYMWEPLLYESEAP